MVDLGPGTDGSGSGGSDTESESVEEERDRARDVTSGGGGALGPSDGGSGSTGGSSGSSSDSGGSSQPSIDTGDAGGNVPASDEQQSFSRQQRPEVNTGDGGGRVPASQEQQFNPSQQDTGGSTTPDAGGNMPVQREFRGMEPDRPSTGDAGGRMPASDEQQSFSPEQERRQTVERRLEQRAEVQLGENLTRGEDFRIEEDGDRLRLRFTDQYLEQRAKQDVEVQAGRDVIETFAGVAGADIGAGISEGVPRGVAQEFSPIQAGKDFTVDVDRVNEEQAEGTQALTDLGVAAGILPDDTEAMEAGDPYTSVELTEKFIQEQQEPTNTGSDMGFFESVAQPVIGAPGNIEKDVSFAATNPVEAVTGPPGTLEQEARFGVVGSVGIAATGGRDPLNMLGGAPGSVESGVGDVAFDVRDASRSGVELGVQNVVEPGAALLGEMAESSPMVGPIGGPGYQPIGTEGATAEQIAGQEDDTIIGTDPDTPIGQGVESFYSGAGRGALDVTIGLPAGAVDIGDLGKEGAEFTASQVEEEGVVEGGATAAAAGTAFGVSAAESFAQQAKQRPLQTGGSLVGAGGTSAVTTPLRLSRVDVPRTPDTETTRFRRPTAGNVDVDVPEIDLGIGFNRPSISRDGIDLGGLNIGRPSVQSRGSINLEGPGLRQPDATAIRGIRLETPAIARPFVKDRNIQGTTVAGFRGMRPTRGTPEVDLDTVDFTRMGQGKGQDGPVFEPQQPFETDVFTSSASAHGGDVAERISAVEGLLDEAETITGRARSGDVEPLEDVISATEEISSDVDAAQLTETLADVDATVFGSGAVRAQAPEFRDPGDIDIVVPDAEKAKAEIGEAIEGTETGMGAFDIKEPGDFAGLEGGETFGFGRVSQDPVETPEGVRVNPIGEELQRKAGASGFFRGPEVGEPGVDVGPRPARGPDTPVREKDVTDTALIGRELLGGSDDVRQFESAFGLASPEPPSGGLFTTITDTAGDVGLPAGLQAFRQDTRGQLGAGRPVQRQTPETDTDTVTQTDVSTQPRSTETETSRQPSRTDMDSSSPTRPAQGGGAGIFAVGSSSPSAESPDTASSVFGGSPAPSSPAGSSTPTQSGLPGMSGTPSQPPSDQPPSQPPSSPPQTPSSPPSPPSSPPTSSPPSSPPGTPGGGGPSQTPPQLGGRDSGDDENPFAPTTPEGEEFDNPVASGAQFLFGGSSDSGGSDGGGLFGMGDNDGDTNPFGF